MAMSFLSNLVLKPLRSLTGGDPHPPDSIAVQHAFIHDFTDHYCNENDEDSERPPFSPDKWDDVLKASKRDGKFVFIYLHSTMHDDTQQFCEEALRDAGVLEFMHSGQALVWGADVRHRDGSEVAGFLKACAFPFVAVCMKHQSGALLVLDRVEGLAALGADENTTLGAKLLARLTGVVAANQQVVSEVRDVNRAEQERRSFREQQDQEYQDTLRADRERRQQQQEEETQARRKQEDWERAQEEEETRAALEEAMEMSRKLSSKSNAERLKKELPPEPPKGTRGVTKLKVRLGTGPPIMRCFERDTTIRMVLNWVAVEMSDRDVEITNFRINCNMPKCSYGDDDENVDISTLETTGLHPSAMLYVQDMDS